MDSKGDCPGDDELITVSTARHRHAVIVTVSGEIDTSTADRLRKEGITALDGAAAGPVIVDLRRVTSLASSGLGALLDEGEHAVRRDEPLRLVVDHVRPVLRPLQIAGMDNVLTLFNDLAEALHRTPA